MSYRNFGYASPFKHVTIILIKACCTFVYQLHVIDKYLGVEKDYEHLKEGDYLYNNIIIIIIMKAFIMRHVSG